MSKRHFLLAALALLGLWGLVLARNASADNRRDDIPAPEVKTPAAALETPAGQRWLEGQPTHWRSLLLQR
jgi:hypothetical protein